MEGNQFGIALELGPKTKILKIGRDWTVRMLYNFVALSMTLASIDTFNLFTYGTLLELDKNIGDYQWHHNQKVIYVQKTRGGSRRRCSTPRPEFSFHPSVASLGRIGQFSDFRVAWLRIRSRLQPLPPHISVTDEPCCVTYDDDPAEMRAKMPCGCAISVDAMKAMCQAAISDHQYTFHCPGCSALWEFFLVRHVLSAGMTSEELATISKQLDQNFVSNPQHDIRQCAMCLTYSQRDMNQRWRGNTNRVVCNVCTKKSGGQTVEICWLCGQQWRHGPDNSCGNVNCSGPAERVNMLATCKVKSIYGVTGVPDSRACPKCGIPIHHEDACKHMKCRMCECNFCFVCLKPQDASGRWQCGSFNSVCQVAPRQTSLPGTLI